MPLENRVDPFGALFRTSARGTMLGNRGGCLHDENREIVRPFLNRRWIACLLEFKGRHRTVMAPRRYTELFFLDEAVAFAAGHRPCAECRRERYNAFRGAWKRWKGMAPDAPLPAAGMDAELHRARVDAHRAKVTCEAPLRSLPSGCFASIEGEPYLVWDDVLLLWTPERYTRRLRRTGDCTVTVLTPLPAVECFRRGYLPAIHNSAAENER
ncbi:MAG TPA: hypothetical protein VGS58_18740 [Candidatus Sulfopaludibacter sp.]|nr:hypothetical protein [Candidatus Sulfopaludibacter sp.]